MSIALGFMVLISCSDDLDRCQAEPLTSPYFASKQECDEALEDNMLNVGAPQIFGACLKVADRSVTMSDLTWRIDSQGDLVVVPNHTRGSMLVASR